MINQKREVQYEDFGITKEQYWECRQNFMPSFYVDKVFSEDPYDEEYAKQFLVPPPKNSYNVINLQLWSPQKSLVRLLPTPCGAVRSFFC